MCLLDSVTNNMKHENSLLGNALKKEYEGTLEFRPKLVKPPQPMIG